MFHLNYTGNPTNTEYFENIKGWTDNAKGATNAFPFEYRSKRKKSGGAWGRGLLAQARLMAGG